MPLIQLPSRVYSLCEAIHGAGGTAYLAGGMVRDQLLGHSSKDIDLEIFNIAEERLLEIIRKFGDPQAVGKSFPVWILKLDNYHIDLSLSKIPTVSEACRRRDLRINSILYNPLIDEIVDPCLGQDDLKNKRLSASDPHYFTEDPLRVLRVAQFAARFQFQPTASLVELCIRLDLQNLAAERVLQEIQKSWLKSTQPSVAFRLLHDLKVIQKYFPPWPGIEQDDVLRSLDRAKSYCKTDDGWNMAIFWAVSLQRCSVREAENILDRLSVHSYLGYPIRKAVLASIQCLNELSRENSIVVRNHSAEIFPLAFLCTVAQIIHPNGEGAANLNQALQEGIAHSPLPRLIQGRDIIPFGLKGQDIGRCLSYIRQLELNAELHNHSQGIEAIQHWLSQRKEQR